MSMTFGVSLVRWPEFLRFVDLAGGDAMRWIEEFPSEETEYDSVNGQFQFMEKLEALTRKWRTPAGDRLLKLFDALFCGILSDDSRILDIENARERVPQWMGVAWEPRTVARFAELWRGVAIESARRCYAESPRDGHWCSTFEEFKCWAETYGQMVLKADERGLGLVTAAF